MTTTRSGLRTIILLNTQRTRSSRDKVALFCNTVNPLISKSTTEVVDEVGEHFQNTRLISQKLDHMIKTTRWRWLHADLLSKVDTIKADVEQAEREQIEFFGFVRGWGEAMMNKEKMTKEHLQQYHSQLDQVRGMLLAMSNRNGDPSQHISNITADISACMVSIENELTAAKKLPEVQAALEKEKNKNIDLELDLKEVNIKFVALENEKATLLENLQEATSLANKLQEDALKEKDEFIRKLEGQEQERKQEETRQSEKRSWRRSIGLYIIAVGVSVSALRSQSLRMVLPGGFMLQSSSAKAQSEEDKQKKAKQNQKDWWEGSGF